MEVNYHGTHSEEDADQVTFGIPQKQIREWMCNRKTKLAMISVISLIAVTCTIVLTHTLDIEDYSQVSASKTIVNDTKKGKLLKYFHQITGSKTFISGVIYNTEVTKYNNLQKTWNSYNFLPGVVTIRIPYCTSNKTEWTSFVQDVILIWNKHHLVEITWVYCHNDIFNFLTNDDREDKWSQLILEGSFLNTKWKEYLDYSGPPLQQLQNAGVVPILDILPNINLQFTICRGRPGMNGSAMFYKRTQDYFKQRYNLNSVIWSWRLFGDNLTQFEEFWPGSDYVDVVTVDMGFKKELNMDVYQRIVNLVGDKPMSMEDMYNVPPIQLFVNQPRWTWFTVVRFALNYKSDVMTIFNSPYVINSGNITFFDNVN